MLLLIFPLAHLPYDLRVQLLLGVVHRVADDRDAEGGGVPHGDGGGVPVAKVEAEVLLSSLDARPEDQVVHSVHVRHGGRPALGSREIHKLFFFLHKYEN